MLTSPKNPKVAAAARLKKRSFRDDDRRFLVEGAQAVRRGLGDARARSSRLFTLDELDPLAVQAAQQGVEVHVVGEDAIKAITSTVTPQGIVGVAAVPRRRPRRAREVDPCLVILHEVRDPGNAGTVLRSADAAGAGGVVFTSSSVDLYNPKAVRSSAGSLFHVPVVRGVGLRDRDRAARGRGAPGSWRWRPTAPTTSTARISRARSRSCSATKRTVFPTTCSRRPTPRVRVPHMGRAESLNLAAAATVCLFEWQRRRLREGEALESIIAAAAHDIRSPLTAMKGFGYALEKRWDIMTEEQRAVMLQGIVHDADRMDTIVRLLVDSARVVAGNLEVFAEQVDLADLVLSIADAQRRDPDHPPIEWAGEAITVFVDPTRLKTAILAFVESLVWWAQEGPVTIEASRTGDLLQRRRFARGRRPHPGPGRGTLHPASTRAKGAAARSVSS